MERRGALIMATAATEWWDLGSEGGGGREEQQREVEEWRSKWLQHYSPYQQILLVGEGDFSFSSSLALAFGSATNILATSLDPYDALIKKYNKAKSNLGRLKRLGATLLHRVNATEMRRHTDLRALKFDRIIFNFPHAGFHGKEDNAMMIRMHKQLMQGFFQNASQMLCPDGEVHVRHKTKPPFSHWNLEELASESFLKLVDRADFRKEDYPGYHNKRGDGSRCDAPFVLGACCTFKFSFCYRKDKSEALIAIEMQSKARRGLHPLCANSIQMQEPPINHNLLPNIYSPGIQNVPLRLPRELTFSYELLGASSEYLSPAAEETSRGYPFHSRAGELPPRRTLNGDLHAKLEFQRIGNLQDLCQKLLVNPAYPSYVNYQREPQNKENLQDLCMKRLFGDPAYLLDANHLQREAGAYCYLA